MVISRRKKPTTTIAGKGKPAAKAVKKPATKRAKPTDPAKQAVASLKMAFSIEALPPRSAFTRAAPAVEPSIAPTPGLGSPEARPGATPATQEATRELLPWEEVFVAEYIQTSNATRAYLKARDGRVSRTTASAEGTLTLGKPWIRGALAVARANLAERNAVSIDEVVGSLVAILRADPRELVEYVVGCCRYCHGTDHKFQRTDGEFAAAVKDFAAHGETPKRRRRKAGSAAGEDEAPEPRDRKEWDDLGGPGFDGRLDPHPECPECHGRGRGRVEMADTRFISPDAAALYAGTKVGKEGIEVKLHSKLDAAEKLMKYLGAYAIDNHQKKPPDPVASLIALMQGKSALGVVQNPPEDAD